MIASRYYLSFSLIFWPAGQQLIFTFNIWCVANNTRIPEYMYISLVGGTFFFCSAQCSCFINKVVVVVLLCSFLFHAEEKKGCVLCALCCR